MLAGWKKNWSPRHEPRPGRAEERQRKRPEDMRLRAFCLTAPPRTLRAPDRAGQLCGRGIVRAAASAGGGVHRAAALLDDLRAFLVVATLLGDRDARSTQDLVVLGGLGRRDLHPRAGRH